MKLNDTVPEIVSHSRLLNYFWYYWKGGEDNQMFKIIIYKYKCKFNFSTFAQLVQSIYRISVYFWFTIVYNELHCCLKFFLFLDYFSCMNVPQLFQLFLTFMFVSICKKHGTRYTNFVYQLVNSTRKFEVFDKLAFLFDKTIRIICIN